MLRLKPKIIRYRNFKKFDEAGFICDVKKFKFYIDSNDPDEIYEHLVKHFRTIVDKHAPLKQKTVRGNDAPFMNNTLKKAIYKRSRLKNIYNKTPTEYNKKQRNLCVKLRKKAKK